MGLITLEQLREAMRKQPYYANRATNKTLQIDSWFPTIRSLPSAVADYVGRLENRRWATVRFGVTGWQGFEDNEGNFYEYKSEPVEIYGRVYQAVERELMDMIPDEVITYIYLEIKELTSLTIEEQIAVDFTEPPAGEDASQAAQEKEPKSMESAMPVDGAASN